MPKALVTLHSEKEAQRGTSLLERVEAVVTRTEAILDGAEQDGRHALALSAIRELRSSLELLGKLTGELKDSPTVAVNILASQEWLEIRASVLGALEPFPQATQAVVSALEGRRTT